MSARGARCAQVRAALGVYVAIKKQRQSAQARALRQLEQLLLVGQQQAIATVVMMVSAENKAERRTVAREAGKWR